MPSPTNKPIRTTPRRVCVVMQTRQGGRVVQHHRHDTFIEGMFDRVNAALDQLVAEDLQMRADEAKSAAQRNNGVAPSVRGTKPSSRSNRRRGNAAATGSGSSTPVSGIPRKSSVVSSASVPADSVRAEAA